MTPSMFLCGGFIVGTTVGLVVLFVLRRHLTDSHHFTPPRVQLAIGALASIAAAYQALRPRRDGADGGWMSALGKRVIGNGSPWIAAIEGLAIARSIWRVSCPTPASRRPRRGSP